MRQFTLGLIIGALFGISVTLNTVTFYLLNKLEKDITLLAILISKIAIIVTLAYIMVVFLALYCNKIEEKVGLIQETNEQKAKDEEK